MKNKIYSFYNEKYDLKNLNLNITNNKFLFLIYDDKYNFYMLNNQFITKNNITDMLYEIEQLNYLYKIQILNFYPVCYCERTLVIAFKTNITNSLLNKLTYENLNEGNRKIIDYQKEKYSTLFVSSNIKKEISMSQKYINRYKFHEQVLKKYIFTEKKRCKNEFYDLLNKLLPNKKSIIDVSCGDNSDIFKIAKGKNYKTIVGNDICLKYLNLNKYSDIIYTNDNIEFNNIKNNSYDVSFCKNTLHHMNNLTNINNTLDFLKKISDEIIIVEIMNPIEYKGLPKILNKYLYTSFLKDVGNCYLNEEQFISIINKKFKKYNIKYYTFKNVLGIYKIAKITKKEGEEYEG